MTTDLTKGVINNVNKINKCPFCGSKFFVKIIGSEEDKIVAVKCCNCGAQSPTFTYIEDAVIFWNSIKLNYKMGKLRIDSDKR